MTTVSTLIRQLDLDEARARDAFIRWSVPDATVTGWSVGSSVALVHDRAPRPMLPSSWAVLLGRPAELRPLVAAMPDLIGTTPAGVTMSAAAYDLIPPAWGLATRGHWDYMATSAPPDLRDDIRAEVVHDHGVLNAVLDTANADAHARPGDPEEHSWMGVADEHGMACVGALTRTHNNGGHLRAVTTMVRARGRGYGSALSAALTRRGLEQLSPEVTLGVYSDNAGAIRLYERLGYRLVHHLTSAAVPVSADPADVC